MAVARSTSDSPHSTTSATARSPSQAAAADCRVVSTIVRGVADVRSVNSGRDRGRSRRDVTTAIGRNEGP